MSEKDNPAARLHRILLKMAEHEGGYTSDVLAAALGLKERAESEIVEGALELYALFDDVKDLLEQIEGINTNLYIAPLKKLRNAIPIKNLDGPWTSVRPHINAVDMRSLEHAIFELERRPLPPAIEPDILTAFYIDVDDLYDQIAGSDLPEPLRGIILERLYDIIKAIRYHAARGAEPLRKALYMNAGALVCNWQLFEQYEQREEVKEYQSMFERLTNLVPAAADYTSLASVGWQVVKGLLSGGS